MSTGQDGMGWLPFTIVGDVGWFRSVEHGFCWMWQERIGDTYASLFVKNIFVFTYSSYVVSCPATKPVKFIVIVRMCVCVSRPPFFKAPRFVLRGDWDT